MARKPNAQSRTMSGKLRATSAALLFAAIAFAISLFAAPQLHSWLHKIGDRTTHECAATLISSGSLDDSPCELVATQPQSPASAPVLLTRNPPRALVALGCSLLEHGPPAHS